MPRARPKSKVGSTADPSRPRSIIAYRGFAALPAEGFARQPTVLNAVPFGRSTLWLKVRRGEFPAPVKLSERVTAWRVEDVRRWIAQHGAAA